MRKRLTVLISGRVQGVFFRAATREEALRLGLSGWVGNLRDGRVEAVFEGEEAVLQGMLSWCHAGPPGARVDALSASWTEPLGEFGSFTIRY